MIRTISIVALVTGLLAAACGSEATATPPSTATATPSPAKEWAIESILVDGSTVTVLLQVFAGIDVQVTLDGRVPDQVNAPIPILEHVFQDVTPGQHTVEVRDVVGYSETAEVVVPTALPLMPWLRELIQRLESEPVANPPAFIAQYEYKGQTVYFLPQRCCDIFSDLYDADGVIIGHPDGGITGQGDGRVPDFLEAREDETVVWRDRRSHDPGLVQVPAPIESVELLIMESFPPQYSLVVVSGLPNACVSFAGYRLERGGDTVSIEMLNWRPADPGVICAQVYGTTETRIPLGSDFDPDTTYTVDVNGEKVALING
ncbi:MAG: hypothetical protein O7D33_08195 [Chloroflexi bacterium]|nr:hypothetical protein [Chloroflexota bacterium]